MKKIIISLLALLAVAILHVLSLVPPGGQSQGMRGALIAVALTTADTPVEAICFPGKVPVKFQPPNQLQLTNQQDGTAPEVGGMDAGILLPRGTTVQ